MDGGILQGAYRVTGDISQVDRSIAQVDRGIIHMIRGRHSNDHMHRYGHWALHMDGVPYRWTGGMLHIALCRDPSTRHLNG